MTDGEFEHLMWFVCQEFGIDEEAPKKRSQKREYCQARRCIIFIAREKEMTLVKIGEKLNRSHTAIMYQLANAMNNVVEGNNPVADTIKKWERDHG